MGAENRESCSQRDSAEREGYVRAHRSFRRIWKERDSAQPELLEKILDKDNLNRAFKRVKANKGAPGIDGMTVEEAGAYLRKTQKELIGRIKRGKYTPDPVRRVEIPKPDGGIRKLGIPTVKDRIFQQAITQQLMPVYEPLFSENSYGYRPGISAKAAILKVKEYAEQGYTHAVTLDLSKYFDTLNHEMLLNILRRNVKDERVIQWIKRYLKSGVMENGVVMETEEGSPQGGNISPLLANIYLNEFDQEFEKILARRSSERKMTVAIRLADTAFGFALTLTDEDDNRVTLSLPRAKEQARTLQEENLKTQLAKLGNTPFEAERVDIDFTENWFLPASVLADFRRQAIEKLIAARRINYRRELAVLRPTTHAFPQTTLTYLGNVMNARAASFYAGHGVASIAPAFEQTPVEKAVLMFCKHCLRYSMGWCPVHQRERSPYREPYYLVSTDGKRFRLEFDCRNCQMKVSAL